MKDEKNTLKGTLAANQMSNRILPHITTNHSFNLVYILLTKENRFCFVFKSDEFKMKLGWPVSSAG